MLIIDDAAAASSKVKSELPGREKEAKKTAEEYSAAAGAKFDSAVGRLNYDALQRY